MKIQVILQGKKIIAKKFWILQKMIYKIDLCVKVLL